MQPCLKAGERLVLARRAWQDQDPAIRHLAMDRFSSALVENRFGAAAVRRAPVVLFAVTTARLLLLVDERLAGGGIGDLLFACPRGYVSVTPPTRWLARVTLSERASGATIARLTFGLVGPRTSALLRRLSTEDAS